MKASRISFGVLALTLMFSFQNCSQTRFQAQVAVEDLSSEAQEETQDISVDEPSAPAPVIVQQPAPQPAPAPAPAPSPVTYSTCATETVVKACPSNTPNCTCTDTLRGGTYDITSLIRGKHTDDVPASDGSYDKGPNCNVGGTAVHSGVVVNMAYGTCHHFCTVMAKCVNGQWTDFYVTW